MAEELNLYVTLVAKPGYEEHLAEALQSLSKASLATDICTQFDVSRALGNPAEFHLYESFLSPEAYPEHVKTAHAQHFINFVLPEYIDSRSVIFLKKTTFTT
jgi:quinol monooxygenase YgiN